ncbi:hypothetical protein [Erwinia sp. SLM-02]
MAYSTINTGLSVNADSPVLLQHGANILLFPCLMQAENYHCTGKDKDNVA